MDPVVRFLIRCGSRAYFVAGLVTSLVMFGRGCDVAECDNCEPDPEPVICGGKECPASACVVNIRCDDDDIVCIGDRIPGWEDANACTEDICDEKTGEVTHVEVTKEEIDDGDPCTNDTCYTTEGIVHQDICGGA